MGDQDLGNIRREYSRHQLDGANMPSDPMELFVAWLEQAKGSGITDPTAMTLSTVDGKGNPSSRIVLLKKVEEGKLIFFTNYNSKKAHAIGENSRVATHFYWHELERQVKIAGTVSSVEDAVSDLYFQSRPYESKIAAWASPQSEEIPNRQYLEEAFEKYKKRFKESGNIPRPTHWGGYAISPARVEFWQGGNHRLHDRIEYSKKQDQWNRVRLAP